MSLLVCLLAGLYGLPDAPALPAPDAAAARRIGEALAAIRSGDGERTDRAIRELALIGEAALPAIVARLNEAEAGERLLLLAAASRMPAAAPLLEQARGDPHPAVRAWVSTPARTTPALGVLARRYLLALDCSERSRRDEIGTDLDRVLADLKEANREEAYRRAARYARRVRIDETGESRRDPTYAAMIKATRDAAATAFARVGAVALRDKTLQPDLADPVFVAYVALLEEESIASYYAVNALVAVGEASAPALEALLPREHHEPGRLVRILRAVRPDRGRGLYAGFGGQRIDVKRALLDIAPTVLGAQELRDTYSAAAIDETTAVRTLALDGLLQMPAPAGVEVARRLLDPEQPDYGAAEFRRAAELLARAGDLELLAAFAEADVPDLGSEQALRLRLVNQACRSALREARGPAVEALGVRFLAAESLSVRTLGIDLVRSAETLLRHARGEPREALAVAALERALELHGAAVVDEVVKVLAERTTRMPFRLRRILGRVAGPELFLGWLRSGDRDLREAGYTELAERATIDARHEAALLEAYRGAAEDEREDALAALLPLGTDAVRRLFEPLGDAEVSVLRARAISGGSIDFPLPLRKLVDGADPARLGTIRTIAQALPTVEPGLFLALVQAWEDFPAGEGAESDIDGGVAGQEREVFAALARSDDRESADQLFTRLLTGKTERVEWIVGTLKAAARLVPPERLALLLPVMRAATPSLHPLEDRQPPPYDAIRYHVLAAGVAALSYARVEAALDDLCDWMLDPALQPGAFDWEYAPELPVDALNALRHFEAAKVEAALRKALARAEDSGRLAEVHAEDLFRLVRACAEGRERGRELWEVSLLLGDVLARLPWEGDVGYERMRARGGLRRYAEAAALGRAEAERKRARGVTDADDFKSPRLLEGRVRIYEAKAGADAAAWRQAIDALGDDPWLLYIAAWHHLFAPDLALAELSAERSFHATAGLWHPSRDVLAGVRLAQGRPADAMRLLDPVRRLDVKRIVTGGWHLFFQAKAELALGDASSARNTLEAALVDDRRVIPFARIDPAFASGFDEVFSRVEEEFFDALFRFN